MVTAVPPATDSLPSPATRAAGLEAQVQRYQKELSDCVNCSSASTPEGKLNIDNIAGQISSAKTKITQLDSTSPRTAVAETPASTLNLNQPGPNSGNFISTTGSLINTAA